MVGVPQVVHVDLVLLLCKLVTLVDVWLQTLAKVAQTLEPNANGQDEYGDGESREHGQRLRSWRIGISSVTWSPDSDELEEEVGKPDEIEKLSACQSMVDVYAIVDLPAQPIEAVDSLSAQ